MIENKIQDLTQEIEILKEQLEKFKELKNQTKKYEKLTDNGLNKNAISYKKWETFTFQMRNIERKIFLVSVQKIELDQVIFKKIYEYEIELGQYIENILLLQNITAYTQKYISNISLFGISESILIELESLLKNQDSIKLGINRDY